MASTTVNTDGMVILKTVALAFVMALSTFFFDPLITVLSRSVVCIRFIDVYKIPRDTQYNPAAVLVLLI